MTLNTYGHLIRELRGAPVVSAQEQVLAARKRGRTGGLRWGDGMPWTRCRPLTERVGAALVYKFPATKADPGR